MVTVVLEQRPYTYKTDKQKLKLCMHSFLYCHHIIFLLHATCFAKARPIMPCISLVNTYLTCRERAKRSRTLSNRSEHSDIIDNRVEGTLLSMVTYSSADVFTSRSARSARTAGTKIALRFPRLFVCLFVCTVCASALITCAIYYVIRYYATAVYSSFWRFAGQGTANEGSFVLPRWRKRGR